MTLPALMAFLQEQLDRDTPIDTGALVDAVRCVRTTATPTTRGEATALQDLLQALQARTRGELVQLGDALRDIGTSRKALRGYGHMRSSRTSQSTDKHA